MLLEDFDHIIQNYHSPGISDESLLSRTTIPPPPPPSVRQKNKQLSHPTSIFPSNDPTKSPPESDPLISTPIPRLLSTSLQQQPHFSPPRLPHHEYSPTEALPPANSQSDLAFSPSLTASTPPLQDHLADSSHSNASPSPSSPKTLPQLWTSPGMTGFTACGDPASLALPLYILCLFCLFLFIRLFISVLLCISIKWKRHKN